MLIWLWKISSLICYMELIFSNHQEEISVFKTFVQEANHFNYQEDFYLSSFWFNNFYCSFSNADCSLKDCTPNASLVWLPGNHFDTTIMDWSHNIYNVVYAVAYALHDVLSQWAQMLFPNHKKSTILRPWCQAPCRTFAPPPLFLAMGNWYSALPISGGQR